MLFRSTVFGLFLAFLVISISNCRPDDGSGNQGDYNLSKDYAYQGEVFNFSVAWNLSATHYEGTIESESLKISHRNGQLFFLVPTSISGMQTVKTTLDEVPIQFDLRVDEPKIADPESYLKNFTSEFNSNITNFEQNKSDFIQDSVFGFEDLKKEFIKSNGV